MEFALALGIIVVGIIVFFLPSIIASSRGHRNTMAIFALNLLLGWTLLGWAVAVVWSLTSNVDPNKDKFDAIASDENPNIPADKYWNADEPTLEIKATEIRDVRDMRIVPPKES